MRVAILAPGLAYDAGAIPIRARLAGDALVRRGHEVIGLGMATERQKADAAFPVEAIDVPRLPRPFASLSSWLSYEILLARRLLQLHRQAKLDLVISHWQTYGIAGAIIKRQTGAKWVSLVQRTIYDLMAGGRAGPNWLLNRLIVSGCRWEFSYSDAIVVLHDAMAEEIRQHVPDVRRIVPLPNGVDVPAVDFDDLWRGKDRRLVMYVGRLESEKCVDVLLRGFAHCRSRDVRLEIVGDGLLRSSLQKQAADMGVADRVTFVGELPHDAALARMRQAAIFCLVSSSEGMPFVMLEAMAAGCAIVSSDIPGNIAIVREGDAMIAPVGNDKAVGDALTTLATDPERVTDYARKAFERVKQFAWNRIIGEEVSFYEELADARQPLGPR